MLFYKGLCVVRSDTAVLHMALPMPRPVALRNGVYHLNVRVPADIAAKVKGTSVTLRLDGRPVAVKASDKVIVSLRTKSPDAAKVRFAEAHASLAQHWTMVRQSPLPLTHKQVVAIAGVFYRQQVALREREAGFTPEALQDELDAFNGAAEAWSHAEPAGFVEDPDLDARLMALLDLPDGDALFAYRGRGDVDTDIVSITYVDALERLFGPATDRLCHKLGVRVEDTSRPRLLREIGEAYRQLEAKSLRNMRGDYSPDPAAGRFPEFEHPAQPAVPTSAPREVETVAALYARWSRKQAGNKSQSTIRRYGPSIASLDAFAKGRDWRTLTAADIFAWATSRHEVEGVSAATVNRNDLVAVSSLLGWATTVNGKKVPAQNAAFGVKVQPPKKVVVREKFFRAAEISAILRLTRSVAPEPRYPRAAASRRWAPWLCAYSGARVQEVLWLKTSDIRTEAGFDVMCLPRTKDGHARMVPLHQALIDDGFLDFVRAAPEGWLFVGDKPPKEVPRAPPRRCAPPNCRPG